MRACSETRKQVTSILIMKRKTDIADPPGCNSYLFGGFFLIFTVAGLAMAYFLTIRPVMDLISARAWETVSCTVVSSEVESSSESDGDTYRIAITYTYAFQGLSFNGDRYDFSIGSSSGYEGKAEVVEAHPPGMVTLCFVNPDNPAISVINRSPGLYLLWGLFSLPFLLIGIGGLIGVWFFRSSDDPRKAPTVRGPATGTTTAGLASLAELASLDDTDGTSPLVLETEGSPRGRALGLGIFALMWNGFIGAMIFFIVRDSGGADFSLLFFIPFVLAGLALIGATLHQALASTNPQPRLILTPGRPSLGTTCSLQWRLLGRPVTLDGLTIKIEGRETATYRRGTDTITEHATFFEEVLLDGRPTTREGTLTTTIPPRGMPSFEADNNKIEWRITVHGDIPRWPDIEEKFSITIVPPPNRGGKGSAL